MDMCYGRAFIFHCHVNQLGLYATQDRHLESAGQHQRYLMPFHLWGGNSLSISADIVKMLESQPDLAPQLRRVRGGYLKIQGTWMPFEVRR